MLISVFYELILWVLAIIALPKIVWNYCFKGKYQESLPKRLGISFPTVIKGERPLIWIHAVSVGEVKAIASLAKQLKQQPDNPMIVISSITETGHAEAKRCLPEADHHFYLPFDLYGIIAPILKQVQPTKIILCETDFWYNFLRLAKRQGAEICVVNGKISERSMKRFKRFSFFSRPLFSLVDHFCLQSPLYAERFATLGIPKNKMVVTGNLKFDSQPSAMSAEEKAAFKADLGIDEEDKVIVVGSTHDPEEKQLLEAMRTLWQHEPTLKVMIVPRHPERFKTVETLIKTLAIPYQRYSERHLIQTTPQASIILLDAMGLLGKCYQIATIAIVAGSFTKLVGGHNILEPLWFGIPMVYGPHMHGQPDLVEAVSMHAAGVQMTVDELGGGLLRLLQDPAEADKLRKGAAQLIAAMQGATARTLEVVGGKGN